MQSKKLVEELIEYGKMAFEHGLVWGHSGNISLRTNQRHFIISASGVSLGRLSSEDIITCDLWDSETSGEKKPSIETGMHRGIYEMREDANAVLHSQPFFTTLISCSREQRHPSSGLFPEAMAYLGEMKWIEYYHPGSSELAKAVAERVSMGANVVILRNHGALYCGRDLEETVLRGDTLEFLCRILVQSKCAGIKLNFLDEECKRDFQRHLREIGKV